MAKQKKLIQVAPVKLVKLPSLILENPFEDPLLPEKVTWTASALKTFRKCPRKYFWKYIMRLKPRRREESLAIGIVVHEAIGKWYAGRKASMKAISNKTVKTLEDDLLKTQALYDQGDYDKFSAAVATLRGMLRGYAANYNRDRQKWKLDRKKVEAKFKVDMGNFFFAGKIDLLTLEQKTDVLVEHKTASNIGDSYIDRLPLDTQVRAYILGAELEFGIKVGKVVYDVIRKCKLRRKSDESPEDFNDRIALDYESRPGFYFYREPLKFNRASIKNFRFEMQQTNEVYQQIVDGEEPENPRSWLPNDALCNEYFKLCPFHSLCLDGLCKGHNALYEQKKDEHEELADGE